MHNYSNKISILPLKSAFLSLQKAMQRSTDSPLDLELRDACIQRFEYTYELANKMLKRFLECSQPSIAIIDQLTYRDLLRLAAETGLIDNVEDWFLFREARNKTSHAYDESKAIEVFSHIPKFIICVKTLINNLESKILNL